MKNLYEAARSLAVSWALNGPGFYESQLGNDFSTPMNDLLGVFINSVPEDLRADARDRVGNRPDWLSRDEIGTKLEQTLDAMVSNPELSAMAPLVTGREAAFLMRAASIVEALPNLGSDRQDITLKGEWIMAHADAKLKSEAVERDVMARAAEKARQFEAAVAGANDLPGGNPEYLRRSIENMKLALDAAEPFEGAHITALEPALDYAQVALTRYALDGRLVMTAEDHGNAPALSEAQELQVALDQLGYQIPNALWMDPARQRDVVDRIEVENAVRASLGFLDAVKSLEFVGAEQNMALGELEKAFSGAGYLLPGESIAREASVADQAIRGTDAQMLEIVGRAAEFARTLQGGIDTHARPNAEARAEGAFGDQMALLTVPLLNNMISAIDKTSVTTLRRSNEVEIVTGSRRFDFAHVSRERIDGILPEHAEAVVRNEVDRLMSTDPEKFQEILQWTAVTAKNDIEAVARFTKALNDNGIARSDVTVIMSPGIEMSRLEDIELGRAEGILGQNALSVPLTQGQAELVMRLIETTDKIVDNAYQHPEAVDNAAFSIKIASDAIDAARRIETETDVRAVLGRIASGRQDALGLSPDNAKALNNYIGTAIDAMKTIVAQDDYTGTKRNKGDLVSTSVDGSLMGGFGAGDGAIDNDGFVANDPLRSADKGFMPEKVISGAKMWDKAWGDLSKKNHKFQRSFIAVLSEDSMRAIISAHEQMGARGAHLVVASLAGREGAPALSALTVGVDPAGYASIQEAMGMGMGGRDGKTKASLMEDRAISEVIKVKPEMSFAEWKAVPHKAQAEARPYFLETKVDGHAFPMERPIPLKGNKEPDYMSVAWGKNLSVNGSGRNANNEAEKRFLVNELNKNLTTVDPATGKEIKNAPFCAFLTRLEGRPIVAPTHNAAEALREVSDGYIRQLEMVKEELNNRLEANRTKALADTKTNVVVDRADAERLIQVWEASGAQKSGFPTMQKKGDGVAFVNKDLPTIYGRVTEPKTIESMRDGHRLTVVDMNGLKEGVKKLGPVWDKLEIQMEGYRIKSFGTHQAEETKKPQVANAARVVQSELAI